jgi:hypothetical protein
MSGAIDAITAAKRSNQRGGRMLSVVDLLEAWTLSRNQAAWLLARILQGSSWLVGAVPGGAGKTTVMSALLASLPEGSAIWLTNRGSGWRQRRAGDTLVAYELSPGFYDAYIWGQDVLLLTELGLAGCRIVSNLHADTLEQAGAQIVRECGAREEGFRAFDLFIPLVLTGSRFSAVPQVKRIDYARDGRWRSWDREDPRLPDDTSTESAEQVKRIGEFLSVCRNRGVRLIEDFRWLWLQWCEDNGPGR